MIIMNPDCLVTSNEVGRIDDCETWEDLHCVYELPNSIGNPSETIIYGYHDPSKEDAEPVTETVTVIDYDEWNDTATPREFELIYRYVENYAKVFQYTFYRLGVFSDVPVGKYYEIPVAWAYGRDITSGKDETHFAPGETCTRGQVVTFLYNALS